MKKSKREYKPEKQTLRLNERLLPELKDLDVGETCEIKLKVKLVSLSEGDEYGMLEGYDGEDHYSKEYIEARNKDQNQLKGRFEVLEADEGEEGYEEKSPEAKKAEEISKRIKARRRV